MLRRKERKQFTSMINHMLILISIYVSLNSLSCWFYPKNIFHLELQELNIRIFTGLAF